MTTAWNNHARAVVDYVESHPRVTARQIAYETGISLNRVHSILRYDTRANLRAQQGYVAVLAHNIKPAWYSDDMTAVPVLKVDPFNPGSELAASIESSKLDADVVKTLRQINDVMGRTAGSTSVRKHRKMQQTVVSEVQSLGISYTSVKTENDGMKPRLDALESSLKQLTVQMTLVNRYGGPQLRKTSRN